MDYQTVLRQLGARRRFGIRPGLSRMLAALARRGHPERRVGTRALHIAGTNGKGSVAAFASALLERAGHRVGRFTSPHLCRFTERFAVNGEPVAEAELAPRLERALFDEPELTFFEICTLVAFELFAELGCDRWVIEAGLGGRLDSTNVLGNVGCSVVTSIGLDHHAILGRTVTAIAHEKAGILRTGVPVLLGDLPPEARVVIEQVARTVGAPIYQAALRAVPPLRLAGAHQVGNARLAVAAAQQLMAQPLAPEVIDEVLAQTTWPGRCEWLRADLLIDGAHNLEGVTSLAAVLDALPLPPSVLIFGTSADKPAAEMLQLLAPRFDHVIVTRARSERALDPAVLAAGLPRAVVAPNVAAALTTADGLAEGGFIVVAGSLFVIGEARAHVLDLAIDPAWLSDPSATEGRSRV